METNRCCTRSYGICASYVFLAKLHKITNSKSFQILTAVVVSTRMTLLAVRGQTTLLLFARIRPHSCPISPLSTRRATIPYPETSCGGQRSTKTTISSPLGSNHRRRQLLRCHRAKLHLQPKRPRSPSLQVVAVNPMADNPSNTAHRAKTQNQKSAQFRPQEELLTLLVLVEKPG